MMNNNFETEFTFDINAYLIESYPKMSLPDRRSICNIFLCEIDVLTIEEQVDQVVAQYALEKLGYIQPETEETDGTDE